MRLRSTSLANRSKRTYSNSLLRNRAFSPKAINCSIPNSACWWWCATGIRAATTICSSPKDGYKLDYPMPSTWFRGPMRTTLKVTSKRWAITSQKRLRDISKTIWMSKNRRTLSSILLAIVWEALLRGLLFHISFRPIRGTSAFSALLAPRIWATLTELAAWSSLACGPSNGSKK